MTEILRIETPGSLTIAPDWDSIAALNRKLAAVMSKLSSLPKDGEFAFGGQKWGYISYSAVADACRQAFAEENIAIYVSILSVEQTDFGKGVRTFATLEFTIADGETGAFKVVNWQGEAADYGAKDKGRSKAYTAAEKYWLMRTLLISSEDDVEPDASPEINNAKGRAAKQPEQIPKPSQQKRPTPKRHWTDSPDIRKAFWRWVKEDIALRESEVCEALDVSSIHSYTGTMAQCKQAIIAYVDRKSTGAQEQAEETEEKKTTFKPEAIKARLVNRALAGAKSPITDKQKAVAGSLENLFGRDSPQIRTAKRRSLLKFFFGKDSVKHLTSGEASVLISWAIVGDGDYASDPEAIQEAARIIEMLDREKGQRRIPL